MVGWPLNHVTVSFVGLENPNKFKGMQSCAVEQASKAACCVPSDFSTWCY